MATYVNNLKETIIVTPYSGDYRIDVLLFGASVRWNAGSAVGTPVKLTYSFMSEAPGYGDASDKKGFTTFNDAQKTATREILSMISQQWNVDFQEVTDNSTTWGTIRFGNNDQGETSAGYATPPDVSNLNVAGDLYINNKAADNLTNIVPGTEAWATLVHEIGHTLGLKHPGNYNAGEAASTTPDNFLAGAEDTEANSIMSYIKPAGQQTSMFFNRYDILSLDYLYGARAYNPGDTSYTYTNTVGRQITTINDGGGNDTIDLSAITLGATLNLTAGSSNSAGWTEGGQAAVNNLYIAYGATIENVFGTAQADTLTGNAAANLFRGAGGNDTINGGAGIDTAAWTGARSNYSVTKTPNGFTVTAKTGTDGIDTLSSVETLKFSNMSVNLGMTDKIKLVSADTLKNIVELYIAYFNRVPDAAGLSYWIDQSAGGMSIDQIGKSFYDAAVSPAYAALTGYSASMGNADFVKIVYKNVLGRSEVDQAGLDHWTAALAKPEGTAGAETRGSLIKTIISAAHSYKGNAEFGYVADLLDNKFIVGRYVAVEQGIDFNSPTEAYSTGVAIAAKVTPTDTGAAITLVGVNDPTFTLG